MVMSSCLATLSFYFGTLAFHKISSPEDKLYVATKAYPTSLTKYPIPPACHF